MTFEEKRQIIVEFGEDILLADGFEEALVGVGSQFYRNFAIYDREKCIEILMKRDGMTDEEAEEFFSFNVEGAWVGDHTPAFITLFKDNEVNHDS